MATYSLDQIGTAPAGGAVPGAPAAKSAYSLEEALGQGAKPARINPELSGGFMDRWGPGRPKEPKLSVASEAAGTVASVVDFLNPIPIAAKLGTYLFQKSIVSNLKPWEKDLFGVTVPEDPHERAARSGKISEEIAGKISGGFTSLYHAIVGDQQTPTEKQLEAFGTGASKMVKSIAADYQGKTNGWVQAEDVESMVDALMLVPLARLGKGKPAKDKLAKESAAEPKAPPPSDEELFKKWAPKEESKPAQPSLADQQLATNETTAALAAHQKKMASRSKLQTTSEADLADLVKSTTDFLKGAEKEFPGGSSAALGLVLGATGLGLALTYPDESDKGFTAAAAGALILGRGKGQSMEAIAAHSDTASLGTFLANASTTLLTLERLPPNRFEFGKDTIRQQLQRPDVTKAEKEVFAKVLGQDDKPTITAKELMLEVKKATGDWELNTKETQRFASYGLNEINRFHPDNIDQYIAIPENATAAEEAALWREHESRVEQQMAEAIKPTTTIYQAPMELGKNNHFLDPNYFAHTRSFEEGGVRHVVELQSDLAQKAGKRLGGEERAKLQEAQDNVERQIALSGKHQESFGEFAAADYGKEIEKLVNSLEKLNPDVRLSIGVRLQKRLESYGTDPQGLITKDPSRPDAALEEAFKIVGENDKIAYELRMAVRGYAASLRALSAEHAAKLEAGAELAPVEPLLKNWHKRLVREELARGAKKGDPTVRFATADTVAKVEGWERNANPRMTDGTPEHQLTTRDWTTPGEGFKDPGHQGIYDRHKNEVEKFLRQLGGKDYTDQYGHTWIEVPVEGSKAMPAGRRVQQFGLSQLELLQNIALVTGGAALGTALASSLAEDRKLAAAVAGGAAGLILPLLARAVPRIKADWRKAGAEATQAAILTGVGAYAGSDKDPEKDHTLLGATIGALVGGRRLLPQTARILKDGKGVTLDQAGLALQSIIAIHEQQVNHIAAALRRGLSEDIRRQLPMMIEQGKLGDLPPEQRKYAELYRNFTQIIGEDAVGAGVIREALENYVTHAVERIPTDTGQVGKFIEDFLSGKGGGTSAQKSPFAKKRKYETLIDLHAALEGTGLRIKTTDIAELTELYGKSMWGAIERKKFVDALRKTKTPGDRATWIVPDKKAPHEYQTVDSPLLRGLKVHPDARGVVNFLLGKQTLPFPLNAAVAIGHGVKRGIFLGSLFHLKSLAESFALTLGAVGVKEIGKELGNLAGKVAGKEDLFGKTAVRAALDDFEKAGPVSQEAMRAGLEVKHLADIDPDGWRKMGQAIDGFTNRFQFAEKTFGSVENLQKKTFDKVIWGYAHTGGKLVAWSKLFESELIKNGKLPEGKQLSREEIGRQVADHVNNVMGGQNWLKLAAEARTQLGREMALGAVGPAGRAITGLLALAPDWNLSTFRAMWKALPGGDGSAVTQKLAQEYLMRSAVFNLVFVNGLNYAFTGHFIWSPEQKDPTKMELGDGTSIQMGKHTNEVLEFLRHPGQSVLSKANPLVKLPVEILMNKQWLTAGYAPPIDNIPLHVAQAGAPLGIKSALVPWRTPEETLKRTIANISGFPISGETKEEEKARKAWQAARRDEMKAKRAAIKAKEAAQ